MNTLKNAGKPWLSAEVEELKAEFSEGLDVLVIAERHNRTVTAILGKLCAMALVTAGPNGFYRVEADPFVLIRSIQVMDAEIKAKAKGAKDEPQET